MMLMIKLNLKERHGLLVVDLKLSITCLLMLKQGIGFGKDCDRYIYFSKHSKVLNRNLGDMLNNIF